MSGCDYNYCEHSTFRSSAQCMSVFRYKGQITKSIAPPNVNIVTSVTLSNQNTELEVDYFYYLHAHYGIQPCHLLDMWNSLSLEDNSEGSTPRNGSCHRFSQVEVDIIQTTKLVFASVGAIVSILVILLIVISRSYKRFVFRLVIYFMSVNLFQAFANIVKVIPVHHNGDTVAVREGWESVCAAFGFLDQVALCAINVVILWIILYLLSLTWHIYRAQTRREQPDHDTNGRQSNSVSRLELCGLFLTMFLPIAYSWIPFVKNMYGLSGLWCWIKPTQNNCDGDYSLGLTLMFTTQFGPFLCLVLFTFVSLLVIVFFLCKGMFEMRGAVRRQYKRGAREMAIVLIFPFVYGLLLALLVANRIYSTVSASHGQKPLYWLWLLDAIFDALYVLMPPFSFLLHPNAWKNMFCRKKREDDDTYFSVPPEDDDINSGITIRGSSPFGSSYGSILQPAYN